MADIQKNMEKCTKECCGCVMFQIVALGYFDLKAEVELAKELPPAEVGRMEYDLKDQLIRETIMNTQTDVEDIKAQLDKMEERLFELR
jgi:hypothetical protein